MTNILQLIAKDIVEHNFTNIENEFDLETFSKDK